MDFIMNEASALMIKIKRSQAYIDYMNFKSLIDTKPELNSQLDEFRKQSFEIQLANNYDSYESLIRLFEEKDDILNETIVKAFLGAELALSKTLAQLFAYIVDEVDLDISFLE